MASSIGWTGTEDPNEQDGGVVTGTAPDDVAVEKFARNGGTFVAVLGGLAILGFLVAWVLDPGGVPLWVPSGALFAGVVLYGSTVRPRVLVEGGELVLHNMFSTVHIPLATVEEVVVQQVLAVRAGERRFVCAGAGRTLRAVMRGSAVQRARGQATAMTGELGYDIQRGMDYADYIESRLRQMIRDDRQKRGITSVFSPAAEELRARIRRVWAWPEIAALVATTVFLLVALSVD